MLIVLSALCNQSGLMVIGEVPNCQPHCTDGESEAWCMSCMQVRHIVCDS